MDIASIVLIAIGLSMDAFAVSVSNGITIRDLKLRHAIKIGLYFGVFQALMPLAGWLAGSSFKDYIVSIDHWIAFILLSIIGGKMIHEAYKEDCQVCDSGDGACEVAISSPTKDAASENPLREGRLLLLAVATSIDALAVGVTFAFLNVSIIWTAVLIGLITFGICVAGVYIGRRFGCLFQKRAEIAGGIMLILIGARILLEHLSILA